MFDKKNFTSPVLMYGFVLAANIVSANENQDMNRTAQALLDAGVQSKVEIGRFEFASDYLKSVSESALEDGLSITLVKVNDAGNAEVLIHQLKNKLKDDVVFNRLKRKIDDYTCTAD